MDQTNQEKLIPALNSINMGFILFDEMGTIEYSNQTVFDLITPNVKATTIDKLFENYVYLKNGKNIKCKDSFFKLLLQKNQPANVFIKLNETETNENFLSLDLSVFNDSNSKSKTGICIISDITERIKVEQRLKNEVTRDSMTSLYNRNFLEQELKKNIAIAKRKNTPLSYCLIDIDNFKQVNDSFGHDVGDKAILIFSRVLKKQLRIEDLPCRIGGDEFAIIFPFITAKEVESSIERLKIYYLKLQIQTELETIPAPTISVGISEYRKNDSMDKLMKKADLALYKSKQNRGSVTIFKE